MSSSSSSSPTFNDSEPGLEASFSLPNSAELARMRSETDSKLISFASLVSRAEGFIEAGEDRQAATSLLLALERYRASKEFTLLARTLSLLASILYRHGNFKSALEYRAAEKLIYESQILESVQRRANNGEASESELKVAQSPAADPFFQFAVNSSVAPRSLAADERRALSYEKLARLFHAENKLEMAKEYALKAIQIRRRLKLKFGDPAIENEEEIAVRTLVESGREEYQSALNNFQSKTNNNNHQQQQNNELLIEEEEELSEPRLFELSRSLELAEELELESEMEITESKSTASVSAAAAAKKKNFSAKNSNQKPTMKLNNFNKSNQSSATTQRKKNTVNESEIHEENDENEEEQEFEELEIEEMELDEEMNPIQSTIRRSNNNNKKKYNNNALLNQLNSSAAAEAEEYSNRINWRAMGISLSVGFALLSISIYYFILFINSRTKTRQL